MLPRCYEAPLIADCFYFRTNLYLVFVSFLPSIILVSSSTNANVTFICLVLSSVNKGVMAILASIANFGTIQQVMASFARSLCHRTDSNDASTTT